VPDLEERARRLLARGSDPAPCDWRGCDAEGTRQLRYGRVKPEALPPAANYCDKHADQVQRLFFVDCDLVLEAAVTAAT
jgi:hypothetical protein